MSGSPCLLDDIYVVYQEDNMQLPMAITCNLELMLPRQIESYEQLKDMLEKVMDMCGDIDYDDEVDPDQYEERAIKFDNE